MAKKQGNLVFGGLALVALAWLLSSNPKCNRGCKTIAEHLASHGLDDIVLGLFGA